MALLGEDDAVARSTVTTSSRDRLGEGPGTSAEGQQITSPASPPVSTAGRTSLRSSPEHAGSPPMLHPLSRMELAIRRDRTKRRLTKAVSASSIVAGGIPSRLYRQVPNPAVNGKWNKWNGWRIHVLAYVVGWSGGRGITQERDQSMLSREPRREREPTTHNLSTVPTEEEGRTRQEQAAGAQIKASKSEGAPGVFIE